MTRFRIVPSLSAAQSVATSEAPNAAAEEVTAAAPKFAVVTGVKMTSMILLARAAALIRVSQSIRVPEFSSVDVTWKLTLYSCIVIAVFVTVVSPDSQSVGSVCAVAATVTLGT